MTQSKLTTLKIKVKDKSLRKRIGEEKAMKVFKVARCDISVTAEIRMVTEEFCDNVDIYLFQK